MQTLVENSGSLKVCIAVLRLHLMQIEKLDFSQGIKQILSYSSGMSGVIEAHNSFHVYENESYLQNLLGMIHDLIKKKNQ